MKGINQQDLRSATELFLLTMVLPPAASVRTHWPRQLSGTERILRSHFTI